MPLPVVPPRSSSRQFDVVGLGESSLDFVAVVASPIQPDSKLPIERFETMAGGQTATALVACARLGHRARYVGALGGDDAGTFIRRSLQQESVDVAAVTRDGVRSRVAVVLVDTAGKRTILERRDPRLALEPSEVDESLVTSGRLLLVDCVDVEASIAAAKMAQRSGIPVIVDAEQPSPRIDDLLRAIDVIVVARTFLDSFSGGAATGAALQRLDDEYQPALAVATLGPEGSLARYEGREIRTPALEVNVLDTTGAGDAFRGGFAASWLQSGATTDVERLLRHANAVAGLNCRAVGAQAGLPYPTELDGYL
ncbi:MAG: carbohydrate kinase family protein [Acidobacteriota bacterium]